MLQFIKQLKGHSGAKVSLYVEDNEYYVVKENYSKARESAALLKSLPFPTPHIYELTDDKIVMEYINGQDMASYLESATEEDIDKLINFITEYIQWCLDNSKNVDFYEALLAKITDLNKHIDLSFLLKEKWSDIPQSIIHGDFTLENIMYSDGKFYLIDANPTNLNSIYFDANKLRQDIDCLWFVRHKENKLHYKIVCDKISKTLKKRFNFMQNDSIMILMLSRILPYTKDNSTKEFLMKEIEKRWL